MTERLQGKKLIVEVGPSYFPLHRQKNILNGDNVYVGIDQDRSRLHRFHKTGGEIQGELGHLPIRSACADEIWLMNVFGEHYAYNSGMHQPILLTNGRETWPLITKAYLADLGRVLKPGGKVFIGEDNTPAKYFEDMDYSELGFSKEVYKGEELFNFTNQIGLEEFGHLAIRFSKMEPYILVLTKIND